MYKLAVKFNGKPTETTSHQELDPLSCGVLEVSTTAVHCGLHIYMYVNTVRVPFAIV